MSAPPPSSSSSRPRTSALERFRSKREAGGAVARSLGARFGEEENVEPSSSSADLARGSRGADHHHQRPYPSSGDAAPPRSSTTDRLAALKARRSAARPSSGRVGVASAAPSPAPSRNHDDDDDDLVDASPSSSSLPSAGKPPMTPWSGGSSGSYARRYAATPGGGPLSADRPGSRAHGLTPGQPASRLQNRFAGGGGGLLHRPGSARSNLSTPSSASSHSSRRAPKPPQEPAHVALLRGSVNPKIVFGAPAKSAARGGARSKGGGGGREGGKNYDDDDATEPTTMSVTAAPEGSFAAGGGVTVTMCRPKTSIRRRHAASACVDAEPTGAHPDPASVVMRRGGSVATGAIPSGSNPCARDGFGAAVRGAVEDGVSATLACLGIHGCGKSSLVRGGSGSGSGSSFANGGALDQMGVCGRIAADVFAAIGDVCERENDEFIVSLQAIADVITAPVDASAINPNKRKTHEVLKDALATGLDLVGLERGGVFDPERVELRGGRGEGARSVRSAFHGAGESAPTRIDVREHPTRGFFAEGAIEVVATDADELQRLVAAALAGFKHEEAQCGGSGGSGSGSGSGERVHCLLQVNVRRRTREGECDDEGIFLPHRETVARVQIVDFAGVDRSGGGGGAAGGKKGSGGGGAAEDAALKALTRVVDSLHDARSHVPHRDSKLTRLMAHAFGGSGRLSVLAGVSPLASRFEESDAMCHLAAKMHKGVRCRPCAVATHYASEVAAADGDVVELAARLGLNPKGMTSAGVELDMDSSDELLALRDALALGEELRKEAQVWDDVLTKSERVTLMLKGEGVRPIY